MSKNNIPFFEANGKTYEIRRTRFLQAEFDKMVAMGKKGSETSTLEDLLVQIDSFIERADRIPKGLEFFRSNISSLSSWVLKLNEQPLEIDYISLLGKDVQPPKANCSVWKSDQ